MSMRLRKYFCFFIIGLLFVEWVLPVFGQVSPGFRELYNRYEGRYVEYYEALTSGASNVEVQAKLAAYNKARDAYREAMDPSNDPLPQDTLAKNTTASENAGNPFSPSKDVSLSDTPKAETPKTAETISKPFNWFGKTFLKFKEKFFGPPGAKVMPLWEKIAWNIGKALVPAFGVMVATAVLAPFSPIAMIVGGITIGAALGGAMTYAFEKRMNAKYRETPKEDAKIWRDVTVQAAVEGVMAPFNLATGGLFGAMGPTVGNAIGRVALTQAALSFTGSALAARTGGFVKHLWAEHYFHYPEKIASNERRIDEILEAHSFNDTPLTEDEIKELDKLKAEINTMKGEDYSNDDFKKDLKRAALSATVSGFVGSILSDRVYNHQMGRWADGISVKLFGSVAKGKQISSLISTMPTNYLSGVGGAALEKHFVTVDIGRLRAEQKTFPPETAAYKYYERLIAQMEDKRSAIKMTEAGLDSMVNNLAVRSAQLSVQILKYKIYDGPVARKRAIEDLYRQQDPEWQKASALYQKYQKALTENPDPKKFRGAVAYAKAQAAHLRAIEKTRREWLSQSMKAQEAERLPDRQTLRQDLEVKFDREVRLNQMLELGRLNGGMAHLNAMKTVLKERDPKLALYSDAELTKLACQAIAQSYQDKFTSADARLTGLDETIKKFDDFKAGKIQLPEAEARILEGKRSLIGPSQYKAAFVEKRVYEMKANNTRWDEVERQMPGLLHEAETATLQKYGGNWGSLLVAELYANGLSKYKYDPETGINTKSGFKELIKRIPAMIETGIVGDYRTRVNGAITGSLLPEAGSSDQGKFESYMQTFAKTALTEGSGGVFDSVYSSSRRALLSAFSQ